jgi:hypothetical protein
MSHHHHLCVIMNVRAGTLGAMAGVFLIGCPLLVALPSGSALQFGMRSAGFDITKRVAVEVTLVGAGLFGMWARPPGSAQKGENWCLCLACIFTSGTGAVAMAEGAIVVTIERLGWLSVALAALSALLWCRSRQQSQQPPVNPYR